MKITIPVNLKFTPTGCGDYISYYEIFLALTKETNDINIDLIYNTNKDRLPLPVNDVIKEYHKPFPIKILNFFHYWVWLNFYFPFTVKNRKAFFVNQKMSVLWRGKAIVRIQDLAFLFYKDYFRPKDYIRLVIDTLIAVKKANHIIAISESTKKDIIKVYNIPESKITVAYNGIDSSYCKINDKEKINEVTKKYNLNKPYILYVGVLQKRKNLIRLLKVFEKLTQRYGDKYQLAIVGQKGWLYDEFFTELENLSCKNSVVLCGKVPDNDLLYLYNGAHLFTLPALYEGFGIPIAEAMACGVPVVTSNCSSMPEVGGDAAEYFDPHSVDSMYKIFDKVLSDEKLRKTMISKGLNQAKKFTWEKTAKVLIKTFKEKL